MKPLKSTLTRIPTTTRKLTNVTYAAKYDTDTEAGMIPEKPKPETPERPISVTKSHDGIVVHSTVSAFRLGQYQNYEKNHNVQNSGEGIKKNVKMEDKQTTGPTNGILGPRSSQPQPLRRKKISFRDNVNYYQPPNPNQQQRRNLTRNSYVNVNTSVQNASPRKISNHEANHGPIVTPLEIRKQDPTTQDRPRTSMDQPKHLAIFVERGIVKEPTPSHPAPLFNSFGDPMQLRVALCDSQDTLETMNRHRFVVDLPGFKDKDISLFHDPNNKLLYIHAISWELAEEVRARQVLETIELPAKLQVDNLRVVRDCLGSLIFEEAWKF